MDALSALVTIEATVGRVQRVRDLTLGSQMTTVLESVGSRHLDAALVALRDAQASTQPTARLNSAVNSLTEAYTHITPFRQPDWVRFVRGMYSEFDKSLIRAHEKGMVCAAMIAALYTLLGESKINRRRWMDKCTKEFDAWESEFRASFGGGSSMPGFGMLGTGDRITGEGRERIECRCSRAHRRNGLAAVVGESSHWPRCRSCVEASV